MMRTALFSALLLLAACGGAPDGAAIDGSSQQAFVASLDKVRAGLSPADRAKFEASIKLAETNAFYKSKSRADFEARLREVLAGMTAADVIREGGKYGAYAVARGAEGIEAAIEKAPEAAREFEAARKGVEE